MDYLIEALLAKALGVRGGGKGAMDAVFGVEYPIEAFFGYRRIGGGRGERGKRRA